MMSLPNKFMRLLNVIMHICVVALLLPSAGCRGDEVVVPSEQEPVGEMLPDSSVRGFYLLNEGNMGSNKCSLDYYDYTTGMFSRNIYAERNPNVVKELGDVGNDLQVYRGRLYAVINCSHKVEVMDAGTGIRVGQLDIPNCRYIRFYDGKAYVSSYVGPVQINPEAPKGMVYEIDVETLTITRWVTVGYQPEEMEIADGYLYIANSGGYRAPDYDYTISVVSLESFRQVRQIPVAINLHRIRKDGYGGLWVTSRGNNGNIPSRLFKLEKSALTGEYEVSLELEVPCSNLAIHGGLMYYFAAGWNNETQSNHVSYGVVDVNTGEVLTDNFISDGTDKNIAIPYGIAVHPETGDIFLTDARNYVSSGVLYCFDKSGKKKWSVRTGDIPACLAFLMKNDGEEDCR